MIVPHLTSVNGINRDQLERLFIRADEMATIRDRGGSDLLRGKIVLTLFFEPSTRTRVSFEVAAHRLGAGVIATENARVSSSAFKGESLGDTFRVLGGMVDLIVMRHFQKGAAAKAAAVSPVPVVNAGDGPGEHPTQALLDLYTILKERDTIDGLTITMCGDLKYGRTIHSLARLLALYRVRMQFVSPPGLMLPEDVVRDLMHHNASYTQSHDLKNALRETDVLYVTRIQKERFSSLVPGLARIEYAVAARRFRIDRFLVDEFDHRNMTLMHPLPRVVELDPALDDLPTAAYFRQAWNGVPIRMAILADLLGK